MRVCVWLTWAFCIQVEKVVKKRGGGGGGEGVGFVVIALSMSIALVTLLKLHQVSVHLSHSSDPMIIRHCILMIPFASSLC